MVPLFLLPGLLVAALSANTAVATPPALSAAAFESTTNETITPLGFLTGLSRSGYLFGDMWGLRPWLSQYGMSLAISETSEVLGNVTGGIKQGAAYEGLTQMILQMDTQRAFNWYGGLFNVSGLQIHGRNLSMDNLYSLQTASGIEADRATRLWELWYQQKFLEEDRMDIKVGQQSLDQEFMVSQNALLFVNTMFGWPALPSYNMPGGGPAYPLSALGARLRVRPINSLTFLAGVFSGSPAPNTNPDPQKANPSGVSFPWNGSLMIAELQYSYPSLGSMVSADQSSSLSGTYKIGAWYNTLQFPDNGYNSTSEHDGNYAFYAVMDQMIWSDPNDPDSDRTINFFARAMGTPLQDRNLLAFSMNAGFTFHEPIRNRDDDTFGIGMGYVRVSNGVADADEAFNLNNPGSTAPVQSGETFVEVTYQYELTPWCDLQPDFQYVFNPGGGLPNPDAPGQRIKNEAVIGLRANIIF
ncbi:MAG TPA: carbohydrate porin [Candidatus Sulfotelmatobacter sp.]|nr:carbohydrate porin [Candidatus Sulfotelmatobacter sp.]